MNYSPLLALGGKSRIVHSLYPYSVRFTYYVIRCRKAGFQVFTFLSTNLFIQFYLFQGSSKNPSTNHCRGSLGI